MTRWAVLALPLLAAGAATALGGMEAWSAVQTPASAPAPVPALGGTVRAVSSMAQLEAALRSARDGDVIEMTAGRYPPALIRRLSVDGRVTVRPAAGASVVLAGLDLREVAGLTLSGLIFRGDPSPARYALNVTGGERLVFEGLSLDASATAGDRRVISSLMLRDVRDAVVRDSRFTGGWHGLSLLDVDGLVVEGNSFRGLETDGVRGGGVNRALIRRNSFTDFRPREKDHPDGIQLWSTQQATAARDIRIEQNLVVRGAGAATQGVFVRDTKLKLPFEGLVIRDNLVIGGLYNGITVAGADAPWLEGNQVWAFADQDSWIRINNATDATLVGNQAFKFVTKDKVTFRTERDNRTVRVIAPGAARQLILDWLTATGRTVEAADPVLRDLVGG